MWGKTREKKNDKCFGIDFSVSASAKCAVVRMQSVKQLKNQNMEEKRYFFRTDLFSDKFECVE